jgi:HIRAN domain
MRALFVAWRGGNPAAWRPVGRLDFDGEIYRFRYTRGALNPPEFQPFAQMPDLDQVYESAELFPVFANRLLGKSRPEYEDFLRWSGFDAAQPPDPIALLAVTEGIRQTDALEVFACPEPQPDGSYLNKFFLHGLRHRPAEAIERVGQLQSGQSLLLTPEQSNPEDPAAIGVCTVKPRVLVGYAPRYLAADIGALLNPCADRWLELSVERVNPQAPPQYRLLCKLRADWPDGFEPCKHEQFEPMIQTIPVHG